jgi:hypothetical protein
MPAARLSSGRWVFSIGISSRASATECSLDTQHEAAIAQSLRLHHLTGKTRMSRIGNWHTEVITECLAGGDFHC